MQNFIKTFFILLLTCSISNGLWAQASFFNDADEQSINMQKGSSEEGYNSIEIQNRQVG
jgi:hypothetical protein